MVVVEELTDTDIEYVLEEACKSMPDPESAKMLKAGLQKMHDNPAVEDIEKVLRIRLSKEKARQMLFWPNEEDMKYYVKLLARPPAGAPDNHPQRKAQIQAMSLFYLKHVKSWSLLEAFILADGLPTLVDVFVDPNLYIRGQAIDAFMQITAPLDFDWHAEVKPGDASIPVREKLKALAGGSLIKNLLLNYHEQFPGGSFYCLQIFAFYVSWLRFFYCPERVLRLSKHILNKLEDWSKRTDIGEDELKLATDLFNDFNRFPPAEEGKGDTEGSSTPASGDQTLMLSAEGLKDLGNVSFKRGDYTEAIALYSQAIDTDPTIIALFSNRAFSYIKRGLQSRADGNESAFTADMDSAIQDCDQGLERDQKHVKCVFRRAQALFHLGRFDESHHFAIRARSLVAEPQVNELINKLREVHPTLKEEDPSSPRPKSPVPKSGAQAKSGKSGSAFKANDIAQLASMFEKVTPQRPAAQAASPHKSSVISEPQRSQNRSPDESSYVKVRSEDFYDSGTDSDDEA